MWTVAKHNPGQSRIFKETMKNFSEEIEYYQPKNYKFKNEKY